MSRLHIQGREDFGNIFLRNQPHNVNLFLILYTNSTQPLFEHTIANVTEPTSGGYARITLNPANWTLLDGLWVQPAQTFNFTAAVGNITGFGITNALVSGRLYMTEHLPNIIVVNQNGFQIVVTPRINFT